MNYIKVGDVVQRTFRARNNTNNFYGGEPFTVSSPAFNVGKVFYVRDPDGQVHNIDSLELWIDPNSDVTKNLDTLIQKVRNLTVLETLIKDNSKDGWAIIKNAREEVEEAKKAILFDKK